MYYADVIASNWTMSSRSLSVAFLQFTNDGGPDFAANPFNGPLPDLRAGAAALLLREQRAGLPGPRRRRTGAAGGVLAPHARLAELDRVPASDSARTCQSKSDYVYTRGRDEKVLQDNANITFNPATGALSVLEPRDPRVSRLGRRRRADVHRLVELPRAADGLHQALQPPLAGSADLHALGAARRRAGSVERHQAGDVPRRNRLRAASTVWPSTDQRHRAVFNGIWQVARRLPGQRPVLLRLRRAAGDQYGGDLRGIGATGTARLRPDGTIVPRNDFVGKPVHRVDMRLQQSLRFGGRRSADLIAEVFNMFNRANYGSYTLQESSPRYGQPNASSNLAYAPRTSATRLPADLLTSCWWLVVSGLVGFGPTATTNH